MSDSGTFAIAAVIGAVGGLPMWAVIVLAVAAAISFQPRVR